MDTGDDIDNNVISNTEIGSNTISPGVLLPRLLQGFVNLRTHAMALTYHYWP